MGWTDSATKFSTPPPELEQLEELNDNELKSGVSISSRCIEDCKGRPTPAHTHRGIQHPCTRWERTSPDKFAHAHSFLPLVTNAGVSRAPSPFLTADPVRSPALPHSSPVCPWKIPGDTQGAQAGGHLAPAVCCPLWPWAFSLQSQRLRRGTRQIKPFIHHLYPLPTTSIPRGKKKVKQKQKKIFCTEIYFYYTKFVQYQKDRKKGVHFFFIIVGKW